MKYLIPGPPSTHPQIVQLTALRPTADLFCALLRDALKSQLQRGQMKAMKAFVKTCYSEELLSAGADVEQEKAATDAGQSPLTDGGAGNEDASKAQDGEPKFHGGLGLKFKFPGDPKKYVSYYYRRPLANLLLCRLREASKIKLWTTYLRGETG